MANGLPCPSQVRADLVVDPALVRVLPSATELPSLSSKAASKSASPRSPLGTPHAKPDAPPPFAQAGALDATALLSRPPPPPAALALPAAGDDLPTAGLTAPRAAAPPSATLPATPPTVSISSRSPLEPSDGGWRLLVAWTINVAVFVCATFALLLAPTAARERPGELVSRSSSEQEWWESVMVGIGLSVLQTYLLVDAIKV